MAKSLSCFILCLLAIQLVQAGVVVVRNKSSRVFVIAYGFGGSNNWKPEENAGFNGYENCSTCKTDAVYFAQYLNGLKKTSKGRIDTVISYVVNTGISLDSLFGLFNKVEKAIQPGDIFVFYYAAGGWGSSINAFTKRSESYYVLNEQFSNKEDIAKHAFTLQTLKQLTDKLSATNQLIVFDTGSGDVIQKDFQSNFFTTNTVEASITRKNRMILCAENYGAESVDPFDNNRKGDIVRIVSSMRDSVSILDLFQTTSFNNVNIYKKAMASLWREQVCCSAIVKIIKEKDYLKVLENISADNPAGKRSKITQSMVPVVKVDTSFAARKKRAIIIASDKYVASETWEPLVTPSKDGKDIATVLKTKFGYDTTLLINPTRDMILKTIDEIAFRENANPHDQYIIYFAGHGFWEQRRKTGYIVPVNAASFQNDQLPESAELSTYIDYHVLFNNLNQLNKVLLITDVCFGGTSFNSIVSNDFLVNPSNELTRVSNPYKRIIASGVSEVDDYIRLHDGSVSKNSPFAISLLEILKRADAKMSVERLFADLVDAGLSPNPVSKFFGTITEPNEFRF